jgi:hypothetical protein
MIVTGFTIRSRNMKLMDKRVQVTRRVTVASHDGQFEIIGSAVVTHRFEDISGAVAPIRGHFVTVGSSRT